MKEFKELYNTIAFLRSKRGCPWDRKQTLQSLKKYLIEEVFELVDSIERDETNDIIEEIGDLLLNLLMISVILKEQKRATIEEILYKINKKIIDRHPHVFGDKKAKTVEDVSLNWEQHKINVENKRTFNTIPHFAPALQKAFMLSKKADKAGFGFKNIKEIQLKIDEEMRELDEAIKTNDKKMVEHEIGDVLISIATLSLYLDINPEFALNKGCNRFIKRFEYIENELEKIGKNIFEVSREELEKLWEKSKLEINI